MKIFLKNPEDEEEEESSNQNRCKSPIRSACFWKPKEREKSSKNLLVVVEDWSRVFETLECMKKRKKRNYYDGVRMILIFVEDLDRYVSQDPDPLSKLLLIMKHLFVVDPEGRNCD